MRVRLLIATLLAVPALGAACSSPAAPRGSRCGGARTSTALPHSAPGQPQLDTHRRIEPSGPDRHDLASDDRRAAEEVALHLCRIEVHCLRHVQRHVAVPTQTAGPRQDLKFHSRFAGLRGFRFEAASSALTMPIDLTSPTLHEIGEIRTTMATREQIDASRRHVEQLLDEHAEDLIALARLVDEGALRGPAGDRLVSDLRAWDRAVRDLFTRTFAVLDNLPPSDPGTPRQ